MFENLVLEFVRYLTIDRGFSQLSIRTYEKDVRQYIAILEHTFKLTNISQSTPKIVRDSLEFLQMLNLSRATIVKFYHVINHFHRFLVAEGYTKSNPCSGLNMNIRINRPLPVVLTIDEMNRILEQPNREPLGIRDRAIMELLYATGARIGELLSITLDRLDLDKRICFIDGKGSKERFVLFGKIAAEAVREYLAEVRENYANFRSKEFLFLNWRGQVISRQGFSHLLRGYVRQAGIEKPVSPHTFRHTFATHMLLGGANLVDIQAMLGHSSIYTTAIYTHLEIEHLRSAYEAHPREKKFDSSG